MRVLKWSNLRIISELQSSEQPDLAHLFIKKNPTTRVGSVLRLEMIQPKPTDT
jgi:hypothetical protein